MTNNKTTLVAVYDDYATAQKVQSDLIQNGFTKQEVVITSNEAELVQSAAGGSSYTEAKHEGGIAGFFHNLFGGHDSAEGQDSGHYEEAVRRGGTVVTLTVDDDRIDSATEILDRYDPVDFDQRIDTYRTEGLAAGSATPASVSGTSDRVIPVVQEEIQVGKRSVQRGGVRVYSRVTEQPVNESITLHEERARVERRPVDRKATDADFQMHDEVVEVVETSEEAVVGKTARVVEEVVVGREGSDRTETIRDTVRRTDVQVERISPELDKDFRADYTNRFATSGGDYDSYEPAYGYGYSLQSDPRYKGKSWSDVEGSAKADYMEHNPGSLWDRVSGAVRYGWEKTTNKR